MKASLFMAISGICVSALASSMAVDWGEVDGLTVTNAGESVTQDENVVICDGGVFAKAGAGTWVLPLDKVDKTIDYRLRVTAGQVEISKGSSFVPPSGVPSCIAEKAKLWLDASSENNGSVIHDADSKVVSRWCDRRETNKDSPTLIYAEPALTSDAVTKIPQKYVSKDGRQAVYFGGLDLTSGSYMKLMSANADAVVSVIRHAFIVHGCYECWNAPLGSNGNARDYFPGDKAVSAEKLTAHYEWWGEVSPGCFTARHYLDGERFDPYSVPPKTGFQLLEDEHVDRTTAVCFLFCNDKQAKRSGGDYLAEVILFTNQLTVAERLDVERYLMRKWELGGAMAQNGRGELELASGVKAVLDENDRLERFSLVGVGEVVKTVSAPLYIGAGLFNSYDGEMNLQSGELRVVKGSAPALKLIDGDLVSAGNYSPYDYTAGNYTNPVKYAEMAVQVTRTPQGAGAGKIVKQGSGEVGVVALPDGLKRLNVAEGMFTLRGAVTNSGLVAGSPIRAFIPNADIEEPCEANAKYNCCEFKEGVKNNHWTKSGNRSVGYLVEDYSAGDVYSQNNHSRSTFCPFPIRQGAQALILRDYGAAYTDEAYFPVSGYYELSLLESTRYPLATSGAKTANGSYEVRVGKDWNSATTRTVRRLVNAGHFTRVRMNIGYIEAGTHTFGFKAPDWMTSDGAIMIDDIRVSFVGTTPETGLVEIPNGDFENVTNRTIAVAEAVNPYMKPSRDSTNEAVGWTLTNDDAGSPAVAVVSASAPAPEKTDRTEMRFSDTADGLLGSMHLSFHGTGGRATTSFAVPVGTWRLRGKVARWGGNWNSVQCRNENPTIAAQVTVGGSTVDLGSVVENAHVMQEQYWPNAFTVSEAATITLQLEQTTASAAILLDDLVLADAFQDESPSGELVVNGSFESGSGTTSFSPWVRVSGTKSGGTTWANRLDPWADFEVNPTGRAPQYFGPTPYEGDFYARIYNDAGFYQSITLEGGLHRLSFATHNRNNVGYDMQPIKAWLGDASGQKVVDIGWTPVDTYNDVEHVWFFRVPKAGTYRLYLQGTDRWTGDTREHCAMIDGVSLKRVRGCPRQPEIPEYMKISVAEGAMLRLDFDGTVKSGSVTLNGTRIIGEVNAEKYPEFVQGRGTLLAQLGNRGLVMAVR